MHFPTGFGRLQDQFFAEDDDGMMFSLIFDLFAFLEGGCPGTGRSGDRSLSILPAEQIGCDRKFPAELFLRRFAKVLSQIGVA